jgi:7-keto-8-aminopelargonate synthetase-like enzyme
VVGIRVEDRKLEGAWLTVNGRRVLNFGSCAYLGLNTDERLKSAAIEAIERFGPVFSSSTAYTSVDLYTDLEERLRSIFNAPVIVPTTVTLGHLAALPVLIGHGDAVIVDSQAHSSVHLATQILIAEGISVTPLPHNDLGVLEEALRDKSERHRHVWYIGDGVYSMFGDGSPVRAIMDLVDRIPNAFAYFDDAHGVGWKGANGHGWVLDAVPWHPRLVIAASLAKSFGAGGAALAFPNEAMAERVQMAGGTMTFSGPLHPAELGAAVAACDIHLSEEGGKRQAALAQQIELARSSLVAAGLPVANTEATPLWFIKVGGTSQALEVAQRMIDYGFYLNFAAFPAVPVGQAGLRFTHTLYHTVEQIQSMIEALEASWRAVVGRTEIVIDLTEGSVAHPQS